MALNTDLVPATFYGSDDTGETGYGVYYDNDTHRFVLSLDCILDEFNENLDVLAGSEDDGKVLLREISRQVNRWMYAQLLNNSRPKLEYILAKDTDKAMVLKEAMMEQYRYARVTGGNLISHQSGINPETGIVIDSDVIRRMQVSEGVKEILNTGGLINKRLSFYLDPDLVRSDY